MKKQMKKILALVVISMITTVTVAQENEEKDQIKLKNEISTNLFDLVVGGSLNVDYQYLMKDNQALLFGLTAFDTYGYYDAGYIDSSNAVALRAGWVIYTSRYEKHGGFNFYPLLKLRFGEVTADDSVFIEDAQGNFIESSSNTYDIGGFSAGFGVGYKWVVQDKFSISTNFELTRLLGGDLDDENADLGIVEPRFGVNFGYRF